MKTKYKEMMEHVEVTDEMRDRVLTNVQQRYKKKEKYSFFQWQNFSRLALTAALFVIAVFGYQSFLHKQDDVIVTAGFNEVESLQQLEEIVGFTMNELKNIPFAVNEIVYIAYGTDTAEIQYRNDDQMLSYNKTTVMESDFGHYETYEIEKDVDYKGLAVHIKENADGAYMISWQSDSYAYMIYSNTAMAEEDLLSLIE